MVEAVGDRLQVFSGRGGLELIDCIEGGIDGHIPAPEYADFLIEIWTLMAAGKQDEPPRRLRPGAADGNLRPSVAGLPDDLWQTAIGPSGGGYGDPLERDRERVLADGLDGLLTPELAQADYGVVLNPRGDAIDWEATRRRRT